MDNREDVTAPPVPPPTELVLTPEELMRLMETNKLLVELMEREELAAELEAKVEEAKTEFINCINAVNEEADITVSELNDVDCLKIFLTEKPHWSGKITINAAANHRHHIKQQVKAIVAGKPDGQIQITYV